MAVSPMRGGKVCSAFSEEDCSRFFFSGKRNWGRGAVTWGLQV